MKKIIFITIIATLFCSSCNEEEFLRETPKDDIFAENLYTNYDGFMNGIYGLMSLTRQETTNDNNPHIMIWKIGVDNAFGGSSLSHYQRFNDYSLMQSDMVVIGRAFTWLYRVVNSANMIINRAEDENIDWQGTDAVALANKNYVVGTARLIRAWAYRHLTNLWGDVPLTLDEINGLNYRADWERTPVATIQAEMEKDWIFARDNLAMVEETGFPNSAVASHYLAEMYLLQGKYDQSITEANRVINSAEYQLMTQRFGAKASEPGVPFMDLFINDSREDGNLEVLWTFNNAHESIVGSTTGQNKNLWQAYANKDSKLKKLNAKTLWKYNGGRGRGRAAISPAAFEWFEETDDRFSEHAIKKNYIYPTDESESEFEIVRETSTDYSSESKLDKPYLWPWARKWEYVDLTIFANSDKPLSWESEMYLRLADTYLLLAEAQYKADDVTGAAQALNTIRLRSNASAITESDVDIEFILKERSRELIAEEHRKYALTRNNVFTEWAVKYNPRIEGVGIDIFEHNVLFPIPQGVIDANTAAVLPQNPGYLQ